MDYAEIVDADVRELRATCDLADRPDAGRGGLQPLVDLDASPVGELNAGQFQAESFGVRLAACGDQYMTTLRTFSIPFCSTTTLTESPHLPDTCLIRAFRRMSMPSSASRLRRASHTSGSSLDISRPLRSTIVTLLPKRRIAWDISTPT